MKNYDYYPPQPALEEEERQQKKRVRSIWGSMAVILLCFFLLTGSTLAWFSDTANSTGRIQAGNLNVGFLAGDGVNGSDLENPVDLSDSSQKMFDERDFKPGASGTRYLEIENNGSMPFSYQVEFAVQDANNLGEVLTFKLEKVVENGKVISPKTVTEVGGDAIMEDMSVKSSSLPVGTHDIYKLTYSMSSTLENIYNATGSKTSYEYLLDANIHANQINQ